MLHLCARAYRMMNLVDRPPISAVDQSISARLLLIVAHRTGLACGASCPCSVFRTAHAWRRGTRNSRLLSTSGLDAPLYSISIVTAAATPTTALVAPLPPSLPLPLPASTAALAAASTLAALAVAAPLAATGRCYL